MFEESFHGSFGQFCTGEITFNGFDNILRSQYLFDVYNKSTSGLVLFSHPPSASIAQSKRLGGGACRRLGCEIADVRVRSAQQLDVGK